MPSSFPGAVPIYERLTPLAGLKILVVDDDPSFRPLVGAMLKRLGAAEIKDAQTGQEGLVAALGEWFDLVICDWRLPGEKSGLDVLKALRAEKSNVPFLMMTGLADPQSVLAAKQAGVSGYIAKPFSAHDLETKVRALVKPAAR
jgi:two-component system chemotaxis response regulator CheY